MRTWSAMSHREIQVLLPHSHEGSPLAECSERTETENSGHTADKGTKDDEAETRVFREIPGSQEGRARLFEPILLIKTTKHANYDNSFPTATKS